jgi:hypothetical protein
MDDDKIDMENIKHQGEDKNVTTIENNPSKKSKEERIKKMLMEAMEIHEFLAKNFFEVHLGKMDFDFLDASNFKLDCGE